MMIHVDVDVSKDCINTWSYGVICVRCGCCSRNPNYRDRLIKQIRYYKDCLKEEYSFSNWDDNEYWRMVQEQNVKAGIMYYKKKIRRCKKLLKAVRRKND